MLSHSLLFLPPSLQSCKGMILRYSNLHVKSIKNRVFSADPRFEVGGIHLQRVPRSPARASKFDESSTERSESKRNYVNRSAAVTLVPDFRVALSVLAIFFLCPRLPFRMLFLLVGVVLALQTARLRFRFSAEYFDVIRVKGLSSKIPDGREVVAIGPWPHRSVVNWELWWPGFPVLAYFKETSSKPSGQRHFFPVLSDGKELYAEMLQHFGSSPDKPPVEKWEQLRPLDPDGYKLFKSKVVHFLTVDVRKYIKIAARLITAAATSLVSNLKQLFSS